MLPDHTLLGIKIWQRNDKDELTQAAEAESAVLNPDGSWQLKNIRRSILGEDKVEVSTAAEENWPISVKRNLMDVLLVKPDQMSVGELTTYIDHLEKNNQNTQVYAIAWWRKLVYPVAAWVMALVAFAFTPQPRATAIWAETFRRYLPWFAVPLCRTALRLYQPVVRRAAVFGGRIADGFVCAVGGVSDTSSGKKIR